MRGLGYPSTVATRSLRLSNRLRDSKPIVSPCANEGVHWMFTFVFSVHPRHRLSMSPRSTKASRRGLGVHGSGEPTAVDQDSDQSSFHGHVAASTTEWRRSHESAV